MGVRCVIFPNNNKAFLGNLMTVLPQVGVVGGDRGLLAPRRTIPRPSPPRGRPKRHHRDIIPNKYTFGLNNVFSPWFTLHTGLGLRAQCAAFERLCMGRLRLGVVVVVVMCLPGLVAAQGFVPNFQGLGVFDLSGVQVSPWVKVGYQSMALNLNIPVPDIVEFGPALLLQSTLDFKLLDAGVWVGGLGINARKDLFSAFLSVEANAGKNVRVETASEGFWAGEFPVNWRGSRLEWWAIDGGGGVDLTTNVGMVGGLRLEHWSLKLADPVDPTGLIREFQALYGDRYRGDFLTKVWVPYVGIRTAGPYFKGLLRFSPVVFCNAKIPLRYTYVDVPFGVTFEETDYTFKRIGLWLDASLDSAVQVSPDFRCSIWLKGSWLQVRGRGREGYRLDFAAAGGASGNLFNLSGSATGVYTSHILAVGLRGEAAF